MGGENGGRRRKRGGWVEKAWYGGPWEETIHGGRPWEAAVQCSKNGERSLNPKSSTTTPKTIQCNQSNRSPNSQFISL